MKIGKILSILVIAIMLLTMASNTVLAAGDALLKGTSATGTTLLDPAEIKGTTSTGTSKVEALGKQIVGIIQTVGSVVSVAVLVVLGIKYMMGSTEEKAEYKKTLMPYIIGAILIFAASNIASIIYNWAVTIE